MGQVLRRQFLMAASALLASPLARAQAPARLPTVGWLSPNPRPSAKIIAKNPLRTRLEKLGWFEGKTYLAERAYGDGNVDRLPALAAMLVGKKVDVIWAFGPEAAVAAARATKTIPIVFWGSAFPVEQGLVDSLAKPGRNVTGVAWWAGPGVDAKRIELLREIVPDARRLAWLSVPTARVTVAGGSENFLRDAQPAAAREMGFEIREFPVLKPADFEPAFAAIEKWGAQALLVAGTTLTVHARDRIVAFTLRNRLPASFTGRNFVAAGGLVSYGQALWPSIVRSMDYLDKILRGAKPAELPVELPKKYELAVNLKTAKALGLTIPPSIMLRADKVIE